MADTRDTGVIYTGRASASPAPAITAHAVALPPVVGAAALAPIVTRNDIPTVVTNSGMPQPTGLSPAEAIAIAGLQQPSATPVPSILRQPSQPMQVDQSLPKLRALPVKEFLVGWSHIIVIGGSVIATIMYIASWAAAIAYENNGSLKRRHIASILGFIFQILTTVATVIIMRTQPTLLVLYMQQVLALLTLFLSALGMGMNNVVVDLCTNDLHASDVLCSAHIAEFFAAFFVCIGMMLVFFSTQQRIAMLIDKGILSNIRGRMTQL